MKGKPVVSLFQVAAQASIWQDVKICWSQALQCSSDFPITLRGYMTAIKRNPSGATVELADLPVMRSSSGDWKL
jgi:hypothetical protein